MNKDFIDNLLNKICLDERILDGIFSFENNDHVQVLKEELIKYNISNNNALSIINRILEGKYPERQAYNKDGLLVTFPTPEYKQRAIQRGTHFEENPKKAQAGIFQPQAVAPVQSSQPTEQPPQQKTIQPDKLAPSELLPAYSQKNLEEPTEKDISDKRTSAEKQIDAKAIEKILSDTPASIDITSKYPNIESVSYSLKEALNNNFYEKKGKWYSDDGSYMGIKWCCDNTGKIFISK